MKSRGKVCKEREVSDEKGVRKQDLSLERYI